ncbi:MAG: hypothetical protein ACREOC_01135 [Gemmatimonadales bacterium]
MRGALALCGALALAGCASKYAQVPARLDLEPYGRVALVAFSTEQTDGELSTLATQRFAEALLASQSGVELLELGAADSSLKRPTPTADDAALAQALGREKDVPAVFVGHLKVSGVKPRGRIGGAGNVNLRASVSAELTVRLLSTRTGATVWRSSAAANGTVGRVSLDRRPSIAMRDPDEAYGEVVNQLVANVTRDLRPTWVKQ